jgi:hypothetical protein
VKINNIQFCWVDIRNGVSVGTRDVVDDSPHHYIELKNVHVVDKNYIEKPNFSWEDVNKLNKKPCSKMKCELLKVAAAEPDVQSVPDTMPPKAEPAPAVAAAITMATLSRSLSNLASTQLVQAMQRIRKREVRWVI